MAKRPVGLKEIAYELNISVNTVSRALRDCDDISEAVKDNVREKAIELGYLPNTVSQFLKKNDCKLIAILTNSFQNLYFNSLSNCLIENIKTNDKFDVALLYSSEKYLDIDIIKQCISQRVDIIITHLQPTRKAVEIAKLNNIYIVVIGKFDFIDYVDYVYSDDVSGGELAGRYLASFHKLKKFIYVKKRDVANSDIREKSFVAAIKEISSDNEVVIFDLSKSSVEELLKLIQKGFNGVFFFNDQLAYDTLKELDNICFNVRKLYPQLHIVGYDCLSEVNPGLFEISSIKINFKEFSEKIFSVVKERLENPDAPRKRVVFSVSLHQRKVK
jgi:LacI family transcriptional regulator